MIHIIKLFTFGLCFFAEAGSSLTHGRRQFTPTEPSGLSDEVDESVSRRKKRAVSHMPDEGGAAVPGKLEIISSFVGHAVTPTNIFGVLFPNRSFPLDSSNFNQVDTHKWLLDMDIFVGEYTHAKFLNVLGKPCEMVVLRSWRSLTLVGIGHMLNPFRTVTLSLLSLFGGLLRIVCSGPCLEVYFMSC